LDPDLLSPSQAALILQATDVRNTIEHFEIAYDGDRARLVATDFLAVANYLAYRLHGIRLANDFGYNAWTDDYNPIGAVLSHLLSESTDVGTSASTEMALSWQLNNPRAALLLCPQCGARGGHAGDRVCVVCGAPVDEQYSQLIDELEYLTAAYRRLRSGKAS
jgi:hypothetical protein